jgi:hypothetical protein
MARITISEENRSRDGGEPFPRMKLSTGEKARFILFEPPWVEWVHELKAPVLEDGHGVKETKERKDKTTYEVWVMEFVRRSICLGDPNILADKGMDETNCPACKASLESGGNVVRPTQRFAANIIRYELQGNTWKVRLAPFGVTMQVWSFTARMWDNLITLQNKIGDLRNHDLTLECEDGHWQRNNLSFEITPAWQEAANGTQILKELLSDPGNKATDEQLRDACGSVSARSFMQQDVEFILTRYRQVENAGSGSYEAPAAATAVDLGSGIDGLLGTPPAAGGTQAAEDPLSVFMSPEQKAAAASGTTQVNQAPPSASPAPVVADNPFDPFNVGAQGQASPGSPSTAPAQQPPPDLGFEELLGLK